MTVAVIADAAGRRLPRRIAEMPGQLSAQRGFEHAAGQLRHQAPWPGDLLRRQTLQRVVQRAFGQQSSEPVAYLVNRTL